MAGVPISHTKEIDDISSRQADPANHKIREKSGEDQETAHLFRKLWLKVTDDNGLTLHGFRRFKTTHLLNLRFMEEEIDRLDHQIYQAGLKLGFKPTSIDKLGLRHVKRDASALGAEQVITEDLVLRLRELLKQYGGLIY